MCGLVGFYSERGGSCRQEVLNNMLSKLKHRGPDGCGTWLDYNSGVALGHTRLAVVDLSPAGQQPMISPSCRYVMVFNGEIYNHLDLRRKLSGEGRFISWRGHSDTETLLACIDSWGVEAAIQSLVGMFSFALWDREKYELVLARDRLGEKPMYWGWCGRSLLFGSELKCLRVHPEFNSEVNRESLSELVRNNYISSPHTIYSELNKLPPGSYVRFFLAKPGRKKTLVNYWSAGRVAQAGISNPLQVGEREALDLLEDSIDKAVSNQMLADVPVGAFLSGGVDSSLIASIMQRRSSRPIKTFTIGFADPKYNEAPFAKRIAEYLGSDHHELYVSNKDVIDLIPDITSIFCEPFADSSQLPTILVSRLARQHVTVSLSGDGGDELFGGYNHYQFGPVLWNRLSILPVELRKVVVRFLSLFPSSRKLKNLKEVALASSQGDFYKRLLSQNNASSDFVIGSNGNIDFDEPDNFGGAYSEWMMLMDASHYLPDDILVKVDRASMANSLETRVPMLDHRIFELAWRMPLEMKMRDGVGKWALRNVLYRHVPEALIERPKKGFSVPLGQWLRGPLREWAETLLNLRILNEGGYFYATPVRHLWESHLAGREDNSSKLWSILMFQAWLLSCE